MRWEGCCIILMYWQDSGRCWQYCWHRGVGVPLLTKTICLQSQDTEVAAPRPIEGIMTTRFLCEQIYFERRKNRRGKARDLHTPMWFLLECFAALVLGSANTQLDECPVSSPRATGSKRDAPPGFAGNTPEGKRQAASWTVGDVVAYLKGTMITIK